MAIISHDLWRRLFGADPQLAGNSLQLNGRWVSIVGVMPAGFHIDGIPADVYTTIALDPADRRTYLPVTVYARLNPGLSVARAHAEMDAISKLPTRADRAGGRASGQCAIPWSTTCASAFWSSSAPSAWCY